jgi:YVTN family beta-propeller protein
MHPKGDVLFASNGGDANVALVDTASFTVMAKVPVGQRPWNMAVSADGRKVYVAAGRSHAVSVIDIASRTSSAVPVGRLPWGTAAN